MGRSEERVLRSLNVHRWTSPTLLTSAMLCAQQRNVGCLQIEHELFSTDGHSHSLRFSPDGSLLASGGDRGEVIVRNAATGGVEHLLEASDHWVGELRFSPDGSRLAAVGRDLSVWDLKTGKLLHRVPSDAANALDWSRDGALLGVIHANGEARILDANDMSVVHSLPLADDTGADCIAFDGAVERVAIGKRSGSTFVFDVATGEAIERLEQPDWVHDAVWLDDGRLLRLGWKGTLRGFTDDDIPLGSAGFSFDAQPDGSRVLIRTSDRVLLVKPGAAPVEVPVRGPIALHPDGEHWAAASDAGVQIFRRAEVRRTWRSMHRQRPRGAVLTGDGQFAVIAGDGGALQVFDTRSGARVPVTGLPSAATLLPNPQDTPAFLRFVGVGGRTFGPEKELQSWIIGPGTPRRARQLRAIRIEVEPRTRHRRPWLSNGLRYFGYADQLIDLEGETAPWRPDRILMSETAAAGSRHVVSLLPLPSGFRGFRGRGEVFVFDREGGKPVTKKFDSVPRTVAIAPDALRVAVCLHDGIAMLEIPELGELSFLPWSWNAFRWIDDNLALGSTDGALQIGDVNSGEILDSLECGEWVGLEDYKRDRGIALVTRSDRVLAVRVTLPGR